MTLRIYSNHPLKIPFIGYLVSLGLRLRHASPLTTVVYSNLGTPSIKTTGTKAGDSECRVALDFACKTWRNQYYQRAVLGVV